MIVRIVKMTFQEDKTDEFLENFHASKERIRAFQGCERLELLQDIHAPNIYMTYSYWESEEALEKYRSSDLFKSTWAKTKPLFSDKPVAWSVHKKVVLE